MGRNIEIKAKAADFARQRELAAKLATGAGGPTLILQHDTFYSVPRGRLKLRRFADGTGQLIQYDRPDTAQAKASRYTIVPVSDVAAMHQCLQQALGIWCEVKKRRTLYLADRTRIHLDEVEQLGHYLELEVVLQDDEPESAGIAEAQHLMHQLEIRPEHLITGAYADLLSQAQGK